jgi:hypothetical protein
MVLAEAVEFSLAAVAGVDALALGAPVPVLVRAVVALGVLKRIFYPGAQLSVEQFEKIAKPKEKT